MPAPFKYSPSQWHKAKIVVVETLIKLGRDPKLDDWERRITYSDLVAKIRNGVPGMYIYHYGEKLKALLDEVAMASHSAGKVMITSLVVTKHEGRPGRGLSKLAQSEIGMTMNRKKLNSEQRAALVFLRSGEADGFLSELRRSQPQE